MAKSNRFYFACYRDNCGSQVAFHCQNGGGYSTDLAKAHAYNLESAQKEFEFCREFEELLCADRVDAVSEWHVDCQQIPSASTAAETGELYAGYKAGQWDGNDVFWLSNNGLPTTNFELASFTHNPDFHNPKIVWIPALMAAKAARRVIKADAINRRKMITSAGLRIPEAVKRRKDQARRKASERHRWNCPGCGRLVWQRNPYSFDGCTHPHCSEWRPNY